MPTHKLSDQDIRQYFTEGYLVVDRLFDVVDLRTVDAAIRELTEQALRSGDSSKVLELEPAPVDGQRVPRRIYHPFDQHEAFRSLGSNDRLLDKIESLIGPDINLQHSKLNMKPAKVGSVVEWHQDLAYFPHTNDSLVTTLIYLDDATMQNGCLQVLPRHHTHFFSHSDERGFFAGMMTETIDDGRFGHPVPLEAPAGSVIFMHGMTPHTSLPNHSDQPRRTLIFEYRASDSFPILYEHMNVADVRKPHQLRGKPALFARLAGPAPLVTPRAEKSQSLYQLQDKSRQSRAASSRGGVSLTPSSAM